MHTVTGHGILFMYMDSECSYVFVGTGTKHVCYSWADSTPTYIFINSEPQTLHCIKH
jgi:hypothetical protein